MKAVPGDMRKKDIKQLRKHCLLTKIPKRCQVLSRRVEVSAMPYVLTTCGQRSEFVDIRRPIRWVIPAKIEVLGPIYMISGTRDNPPPEATLSSVYM